MNFLLLFIGEEHQQRRNRYYISSEARAISGLCMQCNGSNKLLYKLLFLSLSKN